MRLAKADDEHCCRASTSSDWLAQQGAGFGVLGQLRGMWVDRGVCEVGPRSCAPGLSCGAGGGSWVDAQPKVDPVGSSGGHQGPIEVWLEQARERGTGDDLSGGAQLRAWIGIG